MNLIWTQIFNMLFSNAAKVLTDASGISVDIFNQDYIISVLDFFQMMGWIILVVGILFGVANYCIEKIEGNLTPLDDLFMNIFKSIIAVSFIQPGALFVFNLATVITEAVKGIIAKPEYSSVVGNMSSTLGNYGPFWGFICGVIWLFSLIFIFIQAAKRSGMYLMQIMVGYLYLFGMPSGNTEGILEWVRQTAALAATNVLQMSALILGLKLMMNSQFWQSFAVLVAAASAEKIAGRFGMSAGGRQTIGGMARGVSSGINTVSQVVQMSAKRAA